MAIKKIEAFTILETIVALLIIVTTFGVVTMTLSKALDSQNLMQKLEAHIALNDIAIQTKIKKDYSSAKIELPKYNLEREFEYYKGNKSLLFMSISAKDKHGKLIETYREIIALNNEKD